MPFAVDKHFFIDDNIAARFHSVARFQIRKKENNMQRQTTVAKPLEIKRQWYVVDATDVVLGRLSTKVAGILMGSGKPIFAKNEDCGDYVIVINADKVKLSGKEGGEHKKNYYNVSGYNGGLRTRTAGVMKREFPVEMVERAISGMLPHNRLGRAMMKKCFVYAGSEHKHEAQQPVVLEVK